MWEDQVSSIFNTHTQPASLSHTQPHWHTSPPLPSLRPTPVMGAVKTAAGSVDANTLLEAKQKFDDLTTDKKED